jgi:hypothetical protein
LRLNVYSQELLLNGVPDAVEQGSQESNTGIEYGFVRLFLHSSPKLHHPPLDDDRSAITFWLPKSAAKRAELASLFERLAHLVKTAKPETGLD